MFVFMVTVTIKSYTAYMIKRLDDHCLRIFSFPRHFDRVVYEHLSFFHVYDDAAMGKSCYD